MNAHTSQLHLFEAAASARLTAVVNRFAPQWPLDRFVAVNPFLGISDIDFAEAADHLARTRGAALVPGGPAPEPVQTLSDFVGAIVARPLSELACNRISEWAAGYYDRGQALWTNPWRQLPAFEAWRAEAMIDRTPEISGLPGFRRFVKDLPDTPVAAAAQLLTGLDLSDRSEALYLERLLATVGGWAAYCRHLDWPTVGAAGSQHTRDLLVIRLAWDVFISRCLANDRDIDTWRGQLCERKVQATVDLSTLDAAEAHFQETIWTQLSRPAALAPVTRIQAIFCIDVRSEFMRAALEASDSRIETFGFAGFFGLPISIGQKDGVQFPSCPPLVRPTAWVCEGVAPKQGFVAELGRGIERIRKGGASAFGYVDSFGVASIWPLIQSLFPGRVISDRRAHSLELHVEAVETNAPGEAIRARAALAAGFLRGVGLTRDFADLIVLVGHTGQSENNPFAAGLHCGACGGRSGAVNARVAAELLNDAGIRRVLGLDHNIVIPEQTGFAAAAHNTTTDELTWAERPDESPHTAPFLSAFEQAARSAGDRVRARRAPALGVPASLGLFRKRASDPSQVRPEWGLAGCAGFIAAPRRLTRGKDLGGRVFLHSYDWRTDVDFKILEQILTAPVVVASWINLQYFASSADPGTFGAGNKVLHNVVSGDIGVVEGNGGDLRFGLPMQSVSDGAVTRHDPVRLTVMIAAPVRAIEGVLARHDHIRALAENRWIRLMAMDDDGRMILLRTSNGWARATATTGGEFK